MMLIFYFLHFFWFFAPKMPPYIFRNSKTWGCRFYNSNNECTTCESRFEKGVISAPHGLQFAIPWGLNKTREIEWRYWRLVIIHSRFSLYFLYNFFSYFEAVWTHWKVFTRSRIAPEHVCRIDAVTSDWEYLTDLDRKWPREIMTKNRRSGHLLLLFSKTKNWIF